MVHNFLLIALRIIVTNDTGLIESKVLLRMLVPCPYLLSMPGGRKHMAAMIIFVPV